MTDLLLPTLYWSIIEASLNIVAACLPTLGPLLAKFSLESVVRSVRSAISLHSIRSRGSSNTKHSSSSRTAKSKNTELDTGSMSSAAAIHPAIGLDMYPSNAVETEVFAEPGMQGKSDATQLPNNRIMVEHAMESQDEHV